MAIARQTFIRNLHQVGLLTVAALGIADAGILWVLLRGVSGFSPSQVIILATAAIVILGTLVMLFLVSWLTRVILRPVSNAAAVAGRVAAGDLTAPEFIAPGGASQVDALTNAVSAMVTELRSLVGAIRGNAQDAAAMAQEISSATEEMSASTEEVSGTCNDLTDRATRQATLVRAAAEDAAKILAIAEELAASALGSAERNAALAELARSHREQLDESSAELQRLAEEVSAAPRRRRRSRQPAKRSGSS
jgi:Methyl-accepting chemotaxis protein